MAPYNYFKFGDWSIVDPGRVTSVTVKPLLDGFRYVTECINATTESEPMLSKIKDKLVSKFVSAALHNNTIGLEIAQTTDNPTIFDLVSEAVSTPDGKITDRLGKDEDYPHFEDAIYTLLGLIVFSVIINFLRRWCARRRGRFQPGDGSSVSGISIHTVESEVHAPGSVKIHAGDDSEEIEQKLGPITKQLALPPPPPPPTVVSFHSAVKPKIGSVASRQDLLEQIRAVYRDKNPDHSF